MSTQEEKIIKIVSSVLKIDADATTAKRNTDTWDSLKTIQIIMSLDDEGISIPIENIAKIKTVKDIIDFAKE